MQCEHTPTPTQFFKAGFSTLQLYDFILASPSMNRQTQIKNLPAKCLCRLSAATQMLAGSHQTLIPNRSLLENTLVFFFLPPKWQIKPFKIRPPVLVSG